MLEDVDVVFHLAGQPGVRGSWPGGFNTYDEHNIRATQLLLEATREVGGRRFVFVVQLICVRKRQRLPCRRGLQSPALQPLRGDQAGCRADVQPLRRELWGANRLAALLQRVRATAASGHGRSQDDRGRSRRRGVFPLRRRASRAGDDVRLRRCRRHLPGRYRRSGARLGVQRGRRFVVDGANPARSGRRCSGFVDTPRSTGGHAGRRSQDRRGNRSDRVGSRLATPSVARGRHRCPGGVAPSPTRRSDRKP